MNIWNNLQSTILNSWNESLRSDISWRWRHGNDFYSPLKFRSRSAYVSALAHRVKQKVVSEMLHKIDDYFPAQRRALEKAARDRVQKRQKSTLQWIIKNSLPADDGLGSVTMEGGAKEYAYDRWNRVVPEALMLYYDADTPVTVSHNFNTASVEGDDVSVQYSTKTVLFYDVKADISLQSAKNIVTTQVQGRDYSRKELVSGGDLSFRVSGSIVSHLGGMDVQYDERDNAVKETGYISYPENDVRKFIQIMQYQGIVHVNHYLFKQFNVDKIIIKDFSLGEQQYKNIQPYSFTCLAVEPDEDVIVKEDTIDTYNSELVKTDEVVDFMLDSKLQTLIKNAEVSQAKNTLANVMDLLPI